MHPAPSIIFFTVTAGVGYGLLAITALAALGLAGVNPDEEAILVAGAAGLVAVTLGLLASGFHLANPKNAWRAFSRFRTSWLSREAVLSVAFYPVAIGWLAAVWARMGESLTGLLSAATFVAALATIFSTAMIYACLRTIPQWHTRLTPVNYILLSLMVGCLSLNSLLAFGDGAPVSFLWMALLLVAAAFASKLTYFVRFSVPSGPTIADATGFGNATVRLLDVGHSAGTFLTEEFGFRLSRGLLVSLRLGTVVLAFFLPAVVLWLDIARPVEALWAHVALLAAYLGLLVERWLFFAEARHVVNLYHGARRV